MSDSDSDRATPGPDHRQLTDYRLLRWLLLTGSRRTLTLLLSVLVLGALLAVGTVWELEMERLVNETRAVQSLFNTLLGGIILFVSVVLSINIAVLTQELGPLQTKHSKLEDSIEFKTDVEDAVESGVSVSETDSLFQFLLRALQGENRRLQRSAEQLADDDARAEIETFVSGVSAEFESVEQRLRSDNRRRTTPLLPGLDYDLAHHISAVRRIQTQHGDSLSEATSGSLSNIVELLGSFASGHEYFRTLYFKREVQNLSSDLLLLSLPVIVFTSHVLLAIDAGIFPSSTILGIQPRLLYVSVAYAIALSPYLLLSAYMLRIVTVSRYSTESSGFALEGDDSV